MTTSYKIFFSIDIMHDFYLHGKSNDFDIVPSENTARLLKGHQLMVKMIGNKLVVLAKVKGREIPADEGKPFIDPDKSKVFRFYMNLNNGSFLNFTNLKFDPATQKKYYFSNHSNNEHDSKLYLTQKVPAYGNGSYVPGDLAEGSGGIIYECLKETSGNAHNTSDTAFWIAKDKAQFVTQKDLVQVVNSVYNMPVPATTNFDVDVLTLNAATGAYDVNVFHRQIIFQQPETVLQIDMTGYDAGLYSIVVNGAQKFIYLNDALIYNNTFGVIDVFNNLDPAHKFSLLDNSGNIAERTYLIRFANKQAYWKYFTPKHQVKAITDISGKYKFLQTPSLPQPQPPPPANYFISDLPIPLKESPQQFKMEIPDIAGDEQPSAPNPDPSNHNGITQNGNDFYFNIHLNY